MCNVSTDLDVNYIEARHKAEGDEFLSITLPSFSQDFERALELGRVTPDLFRGFKRKGKLPEFLGSFMELVFDRSTGCLLDISVDNNESYVSIERVSTRRISSVKAIRQVCILFKKVELECTLERTAAAFSAYIKCDDEVRARTSLLERMPEVQARFIRMKELLFGDVLSELDRQIYNREIRPFHGPGATAEKIVGNHKWSQTEWPERLEHIFPYGEYVSPEWFNSDIFIPDLVPNFIEPGSERPVRVISVPKTQDKPRIIAIEPAAMQYIQQGIMAVLYDTICRNDFLNSIIGFLDQEPNQLLAKKGSLDGSLATLDLSEASDRVSCLHVELLFKQHRLSSEAVFACRSSKADVPGHGLVSLAKFASMGSALTFPIEAMVFLTLVFLGIEEELKRPITRLDLMRYSGLVRVYGDDIIVPVNFVDSVIEALESFGYRVNSNKSFWNGSFRESCGKEYFEGHDVSVVKVRSVFPTSRNQVEEVISTVSLRNQLWKQGYFYCVELLDSWITDLIPFPIVEETSPILGRLSHEPFLCERWDNRLMIPLVRGVVMKPRRRSNVIDGEAALMKFFMKKGFHPYFDKDHLLFGGRPVSVTLKTRMAKPY
jgi:hypothetical protein